MKRKLRCLLGSHKLGDETIEIICFSTFSIIQVNLVKTECIDCKREFKFYKLADDKNLRTTICYFNKLFKK